MKCKQPFPGFEPDSAIPFLKTLTVALIPIPRPTHTYFHGIQTIYMIKNLDTPDGVKVSELDKQTFTSEFKSIGGPIHSALCRIEAKCFVNYYRINNLFFFLHCLLHLLPTTRLHYQIFPSTPTFFFTYFLFTFLFFFMFFFYLPFFFLVLTGTFNRSATL